MSISDIGSSAMVQLSNILGSGTSASRSSAIGASGTEDATDFSGAMTISQIRDKVDKMALNGDFSDAQERALIGSGFQDMNAADPSYQPAGQTGFTRLTTQTFDLSSTLQSFANFDTCYGNLSMASTYNSLADLFKQDSASSGLNVTI